MWNLKQQLWSLTVYFKKIKRVKNRIQRSNKMLKKGPRMCLNLHRHWTPGSMSVLQGIVHPEVILWVEITIVPQVWTLGSSQFKGCFLLCGYTVLLTYSYLGKISLLGLFAHLSVKENISNYFTDQGKDCIDTVPEK